MAEILGVGVTHYPPLLMTDEFMSYPLTSITTTVGMIE